MARLVSGLAAALVLSLVFLLPEVPRAKLAALQAGSLLQERVGPAPAEGAEDERPTLGELVLSGPAAETRPDGGVILRLYGSRFVAEGDGLDVLVMGDEARRSLVRGLRQIAADQGRPIEILGAAAPRSELRGANFLIVQEGERFSARYDVDGEDAPPVEVSRVWYAPDRFTVLPPLVAVALAILLRRPIIALVSGVLAGAVLMYREEGIAWAAALSQGTLDVGRKYFWNELVDGERAEIVGFVVFMLAMVGIMTRAGGIRGLMDLIARLAKSARRTQFATYLMGLAIFFDDYANTILVGSTMRPLTDRFRVSREKLSYLVDSTAAPVAGLSIFSTWIAFEVSTFSAQLPAAGLTPGDGYSVFLRSVPYSFYCLLTLAVVGLITLSGRDFGPMLTAERRARRTGALLRPGSSPMVGKDATELEAAEGVRPRAWRALAPILTFIFGTMLVIAWIGGAFSTPAAELFTLRGITAVLYDGSGSVTLLYGSLAGLVVAVLGALSAGLGTDILRSAWTTLKSMWVAFAILYLAWMIGRVCADLHTATFLTGLVGNSIDARLLPTLLFALAGFVAFATGSSWSTMSILLPLVVGLAYNLGAGAELAATPTESGQHLMVISIAAVLSGAIFGDHCSPISDTTVMSSIASASDHIDHVRTQAPYALVTMALAIVTGYLPATYLGLSPWLSLAAGVVLAALIVFGLGRRSGEEPAAAA